MEARATEKHIRISPRKVKVVLDLIRGKSYAEAVGILRNTPKAASEHVLKLLRKVAADAEHNFEMDPEALYVSECYVGAGATLKRIMPRGKGSADRILKRTSHITVALTEKQ
ncbi:MAG: 50S ribosomal protein L22 [Clostridia bacterium]|nr:50S ribosomal protein L22 [Clostridia bacterium]